MTFPRPLLLALSLVLVGCVSTPPGESAQRERLKAEAARALLKWLTSGEVLPGWAIDPPAGAVFVTRAARLPVVCDFLPMDFNLTSDARVWRSTEEGLSEPWQKFGYDETVYIWIRELPAYRWTQESLPPHIELSIRYAFGNAGGHTYDFAFWKVDGILQARGCLASSS